MWALRRASNPLRSRSYGVVVSLACFSKKEIPLTDIEPSEGCLMREFQRAWSSSFQNASFPGYSYVPSSLISSRNLSSQARTRSSDNDLEEGFSELETAPETGKTDNIDQENDVGNVSEGDDDDLSEGADDSPDLSDAETDATESKNARKKSSPSPLFLVIMEAPRHNINMALDKWVQEGKPMDRSEISNAMLNLRKRKMYGKALQFVEWLEANQKLDFVERDYATHLDLVAKVYGLQKAEKFIEKIPSSMRGEVIYRTLLANCASAANVKKSEEVFNKIRDLGFPISTFACNQMLLLYKRVDRKKIADVLLLMEKENVKPSLFTYKLLLDTKGRSNDISGMEQILETMKADGIEPDMSIKAMVANFYIFAGLSEKAEAVLKEIEGDDIKENRYACKVLLPLYATLGKADDVERIWKVCKGSPRLEECSAAIEAWGKLGRVENAEKVFEDMLKTWKKPSSRYYNVLLKVYANHKLLSKGKELAKRMSDNGCKIGPLTWDALVKLYVEAGEVEKADSVLQKAAQQNQMRPLYSSYMAVLDQYSKRGDIHNAEKIFHRLRQTGYTGRMRQYQALLQTYINAKAPAYGFRERLKADNIFPNKGMAAQLAAADAFRRTQISELLD